VGGASMLAGLDGCGQANVHKSNGYLKENDPFNEANCTDDSCKLYIEINKIFNTDQLD
jgi:hypothetical protein